MVEAEIFGYLERVADLLDHDHVGPEAVNDHVLFFLAHLPQLKAGEEQTVLEFFLIESFP